MIKYSLPLAFTAAFPLSFRWILRLLHSSARYPPILARACLNSTRAYIQFSRCTARNPAPVRFVSLVYVSNISTSVCNVQHALTLLAESFFLFRGAGRFGRHSVPILYGIRQGKAFRRRSTGDFAPPPTWYILFTNLKFQT